MKRNVREIINSMFRTNFGNSIYFKIVNSKYKPVAKKPEIVRIETTNYCNSNCIFCPHNKMKRKKGIMSDNMFNKILKECSDNKIKQVHLQNFGEPLLDKKIVKRISLIKSAGIKTIVLFTNGSLLNEENINSLLHSGLDKLCISFEGHTPEIYNKTRVGLDYKKTSQNIINLYKKKKKCNGKTPLIIINTVDDPINEEHKKEFYNKWSKHCDILNFQTLHNWCERKKYDGKAFSFCKIPWSYITILWNGDVVPCCFDYDSKIKMGNISNKKLIEIWNGEEYKKIRTLMLEKKIKKIGLCSKCSLLNNKLWNVDQL